MVLDCNQMKKEMGTRRRQGVFKKEKEKKIIINFVKFKSNQIKNQFRGN